MQKEIEVFSGYNYKYIDFLNDMNNMVDYAIWVKKDAVNPTPPKDFSRKEFRKEKHFTLYVKGEKWYANFWTLFARDVPKDVVEAWVRGFFKGWPVSPKRPRTRVFCMIYFAIVDHYDALLRSGVMRKEGLAVRIEVDVLEALTEARRIKQGNAYYLHPTDVFEALFGSRLVRAN